MVTDEGILTYREIIEEFNAYNKKAKALRKIFECLELSISMDTNKIFENQAKQELGLKPEYKLRFYRPCEKPVGYIKKGREKKGFLKVENREIPSKEVYEAMSGEEKRRIYISILKDNTVICARTANLANREKNEFGKNALDIKDKAIMLFLVNAYKYNELVPEEEQIAYGFQVKGDGRNADIALNASIPGFTRLSVHLGRQTINIFNQANEMLKKEIYPVAKMDSDAYDKACEKEEEIPAANKTEREIAKKMFYKFETSNVVKNLGVMSADNYNNAELYAEQLKQKVIQNGKISKDGIDEFICFMHPDLNQREIMYLAEKVGFGKSILKTILERTDSRGIYIENPDDERKKFITKKLTGAKTEEEKIEIIKKLGESFFMATELQQENISEVQILKDFCKIISLDSIDEKVAHNAISSIIDGMLENYIDNDIAELIVDEDGQFVQKSYEVLIKYANEEQKKRILAIAESAKEDFEFDDDVLGIYEEMKEIAESSMPEERKEAEEIEQLLLELNRDRGEDE